MVNGTAGRHNQFNWGATASHDNAGGGNAGSVNAGYRSPYAVLNASYGKGEGYSQAAFGASGALLVHAGGVTFGQPTGDTVALVHAPGASGARVQNAPGIRIDDNGYALVPYLAPYQLDTVRIDPEGLPLGVQLEATSARVAPYAGAVVKVDFKTHYGRALIARIHRTDGRPVPFGAQVLGAANNPLGTVGQSGLVLLRLRDADHGGQFRAQWNDAQGTVQTCSFAYAPPQSGTDATAHRQIQATCVADGTNAKTTKTGKTP